MPTDLKLEGWSILEKAIAGLSALVLGLVAWAFHREAEFAALKQEVAEMHHLLDDVNQNGSQGTRATLSALRDQQQVINQRLEDMQKTLNDVLLQLRR